MRIWIIQRAETLPVKDEFPKMRTAILVDKLIDRGHSVLWWTSAFDHLKKNWRFRKDTELEVNKLLKIKALKGIGYKKNISLSRYIDHRIISWKFRRSAPKMPKPDIIIASMPSYDLAYEATMFAKKNNIIIIVDIRDQWPDIFLYHMPEKLQGFAKIFLYKDFQMIKKTMQMADGLIAVTNTLLEWGLKYAGRKKTWRDRIFYLGYKKCKVLNRPRVIKRFKNIMETLQKKFIILFVGTISRGYHNPLILLEVAKRMVEYDNVHFIIAGDGELFEELKRRSKHLNKITLTGWLNRDEIEFLLEHSKIGICPSTISTNKIFAYISAGLPIISAFFGELKEIIRKYHVGLYYPANDVEKLVSCIRKLHDSPTLYRIMSENARRIFDSMFDADKIYEEYSNYIENVLKMSMDKD